MDSDQDRMATLSARKDYFRPAWFGALLRGRLGLGDTFWVGNYGVGLIFMPVLIIALLFGPMFLPAGIALWLGRAVLAALALYFAVLTRAVFITARRTPEVGGWRWIGVFLTAAQALYPLAMLFGR